MLVFSMVFISAFSQGVCRASMKAAELLLIIQVLRRNRPEYFVDAGFAACDLEQGGLAEGDHALLHGLLANGGHGLLLLNQFADGLGNRQKLEDAAARAIALPAAFAALAGAVKMATRL